ncbi:hypothetical protein D3C74_313090 [compost metagenome]
MRDKMDFVALFRQQFSQLGGHNPRTAQGWITGDADFQKWFHMVGASFVVVPSSSLCA